MSEYYFCLRCGNLDLEVVGEEYQWSEAADRTTFWYFDARCKKCGFISRFPRQLPLRPNLYNGVKS